MKAPNETGLVSRRRNNFLSSNFDYSFDFDGKVDKSNFKQTNIFKYLKKEKSQNTANNGKFYSEFLLLEGATVFAGKILPKRTTITNIILI